MQYVSLKFFRDLLELELDASGVIPTGVVRGRQNPRHKALAARLKKARRASGLSFDSIADAAGITDGSTVVHLERKPGHVPRLDTVEKVAYALGLSPAFLAYGLDGECTRGEVLRADGIAERLQAARQARGLSMRALARLAGLTDTAVRTTEAGVTVPTVATVEDFAKALDVSPGWLAFNQGPRELPKRRRAAPAADAKHL